MNAETTVRCPFCKAGPGSPCRVGSKTKTGFWHPARIDAAHAAQPTKGTP